MLVELKIKNFVIIDDLTLSFGKGLNILSGETGAGKSILIDALSGILGEKMTTDVIRTGFEKATLEGVFDISNMPHLKRKIEESGIDCEDDTLILRRELFSNGKGRSFVSAMQVPGAKLKEISEYLVDIHGQNEHQNIVKVSKHREILDSFADLDDDVDKMRSIHSRLQSIKEKIESFSIDEREKARRIEFNGFAVREIDAAGLTDGEEDELKNESHLLANAEKLFREINRSSELMNGDGGVIQRLKTIDQNLGRVYEYDPEIVNIGETVRNTLYQLEDASKFLRDYEKNINYSPGRINHVEERLALIAGLKKKYGPTIEEIKAYAEKARREIEAISSSEEQLDALKDEYSKVLLEAKKLAFAISDRRLSSAKKLESQVMKELSDMGMPGTVFRVSIVREVNPDGEIVSENKKYMLYPHGLDRIEFLLSANSGEDLRQLRKVASGGEMSRIMLALKNVLLSKDIVETLIFDEVDAGIGGKVAEIVGRKLRLLAKNRQVMVVTHLPQIAAMSDSHFTVQKTRAADRTTTTVKQLARKDKIREVARMLAGEKITDISLKHAEEMVYLAEKNA
jgi:DNA repair protein RecN (Recombination protein N)